MTALLKDALAPNLVQTLENNPAFIHGGPFANIRAWLQLGDRHQDGAEAGRLCRDRGGFGADLGAGKFLDIKCRKAG